MQHLCRRLLLLLLLQRKIRAYYPSLKLNTLAGARMSQAATNGAASTKTPMLPVKAQMLTAWRP